MTDAVEEWFTDYQRARSLEVCECCLEFLPKHAAGCPEDPRD